MPSCCAQSTWGPMIVSDESKTVDGRTRSTTNDNTTGPKIVRHYRRLETSATIVAVCEC